MAPPLSPVSAGSPLPYCRGCLSFRWLRKSEQSRGEAGGRTGWLTEKELWSRAYAARCKHMHSQSPANWLACSHQSPGALLCVSRRAPPSHSEQLLEFSYIPIFHISRCRLLHKSLHKALSFPDLLILNIIFAIWILLKAPRLMLLCSAASCLKK